MNTSRRGFFSMVAALLTAVKGGASLTIPKPRPAALGSRLWPLLTVNQIRAIDDVQPFKTHRIGGVDGFGNPIWFKSGREG